MNCLPICDVSHVTEPQNTDRTENTCSSLKTRRKLTKENFSFTHIALTRVTEKKEIEMMCSCIAPISNGSIYCDSKN